ncbi:MAG TPA: hypothetical protein V6D05_11650 [Stenomitos sp.]
MPATLMSEAELVDLIGGQINRSVSKLQDKQEPLPDLLAEFGFEIAKAVASAIHTNNEKTLAVSAQRGEAPVSTKQYYDHLSECVDGY